jgi:protein disulfide-isomerase
MYQTSDPLSTASSRTPDLQSSLNSFTAYYNFHFASLNCLAYMDLCNELDATAFPTFGLYNDGEVLTQTTGTLTIEELSHFIEERLEQIRPGSRPRKGLKLPEPGAKGVDTSAEPDNPVAKDKDRQAGIKAGERHNELVAQVASESQADKKISTSQNFDKTTAPSALPNPQGISVPLTAESFQKHVTKTRDLWFIKFYSPRCTHCQALAPNWFQMAKGTKGILNVGEVNCETEPRLCRDAGVKGYPTIYFFRGGERVEYNGLRGLGDLINYTKKAVDVASGVKYVDNVSLKELEASEEVIFLYFYDHATTSEDFTALERLTLNLVGRARLVKTDSAVLAERFKISTWPRLLVVRDGRASYYNTLAPQDMRDFNLVLTWMQNVWLPIVPELTASNAREIMDGKFVVLGILTRRRSDDFVQAKRELKNAALEWMDKQVQLFQLERQELRDAKQLRIEEAEDRNDQRGLRAAKSMHITIREDDKKQVGFAWVDGDFWERWVRTTYGIDVKRGERVIINDEDVRPIRFPIPSPLNEELTPHRTDVTGTPPLAALLSCHLEHRFSRPFHWLLANRQNSNQSRQLAGSNLYSFAPVPLSPPIASFLCLCLSFSLV